MEIGFIGLGAMGRAMASNLIAAGHSVRAWNRSGAQGVDGVTMVAETAEAFQGDAVFTMLSDDAAIREVLLDTGVLNKARTGIAHVVTSTISVAFAGELAAAHRMRDIAYVSAPVLGRPEVASEGQLNILAGGVPEAVERVRPLLDVLGKRVWDMGSDPARANAAKIAANMMITIAIEAMAEAVVITEDNGLSRETFFDLILETLFSGRSYQVYSDKISRGDYEPGFKARLGLKDLRLASQAASGAGRQLPLLDAVRDRMEAVVGAGLGEKDWSVMADFTLSEKDDRKERVDDRARSR